MIRTHTAPGVAPPAPGAVCPPPARSGERERTPAPGAYALASAAQDDVPTRPDNHADPDLLKLVRLIDSMPPVERRRFVRLAEAYVRCQLGRLVLLEEIASELGAKT